MLPGLRSGLLLSAGETLATTIVGKLYFQGSSLQYPLTVSGPEGPNRKLMVYMHGLQPTSINLAGAAYIAGGQPNNSDFYYVFNCPTNGTFQLNVTWASAASPQMVFITYDGGAPTAAGNTIANLQTVAVPAKGFAVIAHYKQVNFNESLAANFTDSVPLQRIDPPLGAYPSEFRYYAVTPLSAQGTTVTSSAAWVSAGTPSGVSAKFTLP